MKTRFMLLAFFLTLAISISAQSFKGILRDAKNLKDDGNKIEEAKK